MLVTRRNFAAVAVLIFRMTDESRRARERESTLSTQERLVYKASTSTLPLRRSDGILKSGTAVVNISYAMDYCCTLLCPRCDLSMYTMYVVHFPCRFVYRQYVDRLSLCSCFTYSICHQVTVFNASSTCKEHVILCNMHTYTYAYEGSKMLNDSTNENLEAVRLVGLHVRSPVPGFLELHHPRLVN